MNAALLTDSLPADVTGWWVSEKYDGVRAILTENGTLISRHGKPLNPPASFMKGMPKGVRLDGELWAGRGMFDQLVSTIQTKGGEWHGVFFMVFDLAEAGTFEERDAKLSSISRQFPAHVKKVDHWKLTGNSDLDGMESDIVSYGGEGCVIRRPGSPYRPGRMGDVIKVKRLTADIDRWQG